MSALTCTAGRRCSCAQHTARRTYQREYAAKRRGASLAARRMSARTCPRRHGAHGVCGAVLDSTTVNGRLVVSCPACERMARGICRDCPAPVAGTVGKARRCASCRDRAKHESERAYAERNRDEVNRRGRQYYQDNAERRAARNEYKKAWRKANPEKVKAYKRREALAQGEHRLAWHRRHNRKKARILKKRQQALLAYYREHPTRPTPKCAGCDQFLNWTPRPGGKGGRPPRWCDACAPVAEQKRRAKNGRSVTTCDAPPPAQWAPSLRELEQRAGVRTCVSTGCDIVVTGRKKKCTRCRERERQAALEALACRRSVAA